MNKKQALVKFLDVKPNEVTVSKYDENTFEVGPEEYMVLTDKEADQKVKEYILESIWAFRAEFLSAHMDLDVKSIQKVQELSEGANPILKQLIRDLNHFVKDAVMSDGRGHFLSGYDGEEQESDRFFIYRIN